MANVYIVMGVSGCGKTTIGEILAEKLGIPFYDADDFHQQANVYKMASGTPLEDEDRWPWLDILAVEIQKWKEDKGAVLACSALKEVYRKRLFSNHNAFAKAKKNFIYLDSSFEVISKRLEQRENHFFDPSLLKSQFDTLEVPEYGIHVSVEQPMEIVINQIIGLIQ